MFFRKHLLESLDQGLFLRRASAQLVAADLIGVQVHFGSHQAMHPQRLHRPAMAQHPDRTRFIRAPHVNDRAFGTTLQIQLPSFGKLSPPRRLVVADGTALPVGRTNRSLVAWKALGWAW